MREHDVIRPAQANESNVLGDLTFRSKAFWGYSAEFMAACREELSVSAEDVRNPSRAYMVYESNGAIIGYCGLERLSSSEFELGALFVEPTLVGSGIGKALMIHAKAAARAASAHSIVIQSDPNAAKFYESAGALQTGERESDSIPGRFLPEFRIWL